MEVAVSAVNDIPNAPGAKQVALSVTFADGAGSVLHRIDFSTRVEGRTADSSEAIRSRAIGLAKNLAREFAAG
jgi:hypothetical protein